MPSWPIGTPKIRSPDQKTKVRYTPSWPIGTPNLRGTDFLFFSHCFKLFPSALPHLSRKVSWKPAASWACTCNPSPDPPLPSLRTQTHLTYPPSPNPHPYSRWARVGLRPSGKAEVRLIVKAGHSRRSCRHKQVSRHTRRAACHRSSRRGLSQHIACMQHMTHHSVDTSQLCCDVLGHAAAECDGTPRRYGAHMSSISSRYVVALCHCMSQCIVVCHSMTLMMLC